jgi:glyoxylase-like metal-dependent hydrolase (beta-lactamase superfamily II)
MLVTIDCQYLQPRFAASYLMIEDDRALFIETNTAHSVPILLKSLSKHGLLPEQVEYVIITHVHLDHAGGCSTLMRACPNATLLVHPRASRHMIDPSKLIASAQKVYGVERFAELYGVIESIRAERVREMQDGEVLRFGSRELRFIYTRGHANHHLCVYDSGTDGVFTGDAFGLAYPVLQNKGLFIFPSTSPTDFNPTEARLSLEKIVNTGATRVYLTHFGEVRDIKAAVAQLREHLDFCEQLLQEAIQSALTSALSEEALSLICAKKLRKYFDGVLRTRGIEPTKEIWELLKLDLDLNAAGIAYVALKFKQAQAEAIEGRKK